MLWMKNLILAWRQAVGPYVSTLIATVGTLGLGACLLILLGLSKLFQETWEKESFQFDTTLLKAIHGWASPALDKVALTVTRLADPEVVVVLVLSMLFWLGWKRRVTEAKFFALACLGALILNNALKLAFSKARPELWPRLITETSFSFPSGHALGAMVLYGFLAYLLAQNWPRLSALIYAAAFTIITLIGLSRLYLGVHWPTDVVAGFGVGFLWLIICITLLKLQQTQPVGRLRKWR
jgi:membrane-associated phospholipid phosphatase